MVQPIQKIWNPNTLQWEQIVPTKEEFDGLAGTGRTTETVKGNKDQIDVLSQNVNSHQADDTIHFQKTDVSKTDVGLGNVTNDRQATKTEFDAHQADEVSQGEVHGLRVSNEKLEYYTGTEWKIASGGIDDLNGSPGAKNLISGTMEEGFFGEVSASELISGDALASLVGISQGTSQNSTAGWLKFAWQGKILFVAKKAFRNSISWDHINSANAAYGGRTVGIDGLTYKIRLMKGANKDPAGAYSGAICHGSEWNRLMLPIHQEAINKNWAYPDNVESDIPVWAHSLGTGTQGRYTDEDLLTKSDYGSGSYSWCQEVAESAAIRVGRGRYGVSNSGSSTSSSAGGGGGWRPCLELVP